MKSVAIAFIACAFVLTACGGSGGGSTSPTPAPAPVTVFPVDSVITKLASSGRSFSVSNVDANGKQSKLVVDYVPGASGWFSRRQNLSTNGTGGVTTQENVNFIRTGDLFKVVGWIDSNANPAVISASAALPATSNVGSNGTLAEGSILIQDNGINTSDIGLTHSLRYLWTLAAVTDTTADLCLTTWNIGDFISNFATDCFRIDAAGSISAFKSTVGYHAKGIDSQTVYQ